MQRTADVNASNAIKCRKGGKRMLKKKTGDKKKQDKKNGIFELPSLLSKNDKEKF